MRTALWYPIMFALVSCGKIILKSSYKTFDPPIEKKPPSYLADYWAGPLCTPEDIENPQTTCYFNKGFRVGHTYTLTGEALGHLMELNPHTTRCNDNRAHTVCIDKYFEGFFLARAIVIPKQLECLESECLVTPDTFSLKKGISARLRYLKKLQDGIEDEDIGHVIRPSLPKGFNLGTPNNFTRYGYKSVQGPSRCRIWFKPILWKIKGFLRYGGIYNHIEKSEMDVPFPAILDNGRIAGIFGTTCEPLPHTKLRY